MILRCYESNIEEPYLILEDLANENYRNCDRRHGLDMDHFKLVLTQLARWHAATAVLGTEVNAICIQFSDIIYSSLFAISAAISLIQSLPHIEKFLTGIYNKDSDDIEKFVVAAFRAATELTKTWTHYENISEKLAKATPKAFHKTCDSAECDGRSFVALLHGDLWANNIMFTFDENDRPTEAIMIDFQIGSWGPVAVDLGYALFTSSHQDFRDKEWDCLLAVYQRELKRVLELLDYSAKVPTLSEIQAQFLLKGCSMVPMGFIGVGLRHFEKGTDDTMARYLIDTEENRQFQLDMIANPRCRPCIEFLLDFFDRKGFLDID